MNGTFDMDPDQISEKLSDARKKAREQEARGVDALYSSEAEKLTKPQIDAMDRPTLDRYLRARDPNYDPSAVSDINVARQSLLDRLEGKTPSPAAEPAAEPVVPMLGRKPRAPPAEVTVPAPPSDDAFKGYLSQIDGLRRDVNMAEGRARKLAGEKSDLVASLGSAQEQIDGLTEADQILRSEVARRSAENSSLQSQLTAASNLAGVYEDATNACGELTNEMLKALSTGRNSYKDFGSLADRLVALTQKGSTEYRPDWPVFVIQASETAAALKEHVDLWIKEGDDLKSKEEELAAMGKGKEAVATDRDERVNAYKRAIECLSSIASAVMRDDFTEADTLVTKLNSSTGKSGTGLSEYISPEHLGALIRAGSKMIDLTVTCREDSEYFKIVQDHIATSLGYLKEGKVKEARKEFDKLSTAKKRVRRLFAKAGGTPRPLHTPDHVESVKAELTILSDHLAGVYEKLVEYEALQATYTTTDSSLARTTGQLVGTRGTLRERDRELRKVNRELGKKDGEIANRDEEIESLKSRLAAITGEAPAEREGERAGLLAGASDYLGYLKDCAYLRWCSLIGRELSPASQRLADKLGRRRQLKVLNAEAPFQELRVHEALGAVAPSRVKAARAELDRVIYSAEKTYVRGLRLLHKRV